MARFGIFCLPGRGHLYPAAALGRELERRGHQYILFNGIVARAFARTSGLSFRELCLTPAPNELPQGRPCFQHIGYEALNAIEKHATLILRSGFEAVKECRLDALLVDQADLASGSVAEVLGLPFVSLSFFPPVYLSDTNPPFIHTWSGRGGAFARSRIRSSNAAFSRFFTPTLEMVNDFRLSHGLRRFFNLNDAFSNLSIITQLPKVLELPHVQMPDHVQYTAPFDDGLLRRKLDFPWDRLNGLPVAYLTLGTVRNRQAAPFVTIAGALADLRIQLVISLGGTYLSPDDLPNLPGDPIVVHYAPQRDVLSRATVTIFHGGMNTCLESVAAGVPMLAIPIADDQPGVAARVRMHGLGEILPYRKLTKERVRSLISKILLNGEFSANAKSFQDQILVLSGARLAIDRIEALLR